MKYSQIKKWIDKTIIEENIPNLELEEVVLVQGKLVENQYQQKADVLCIFAYDRFYAGWYHHFMLDHTSIFKLKLYIVRNGRLS